MNLYLVFAYGLVLTALFAYLRHLGKRLRNVEEEIDLLRKELEPDAHLPERERLRI